MTCTRPSALKWTYAFVFCYSLVTLLHDTWVSFDSKPLEGQFTPDAQAGNMIVVIASFGFFSLAVGLHIIRLYLSMEMMEGCLVYHKEVLGDVDERQKPIEFFIRIVVVALISLKIHLHIVGIGSLSRSLLAVYGTLLAWDIFVLSCKKIRLQNSGKGSLWKNMSITERTFLTSSISGVVLSLTVILMLKLMVKPPVFLELSIFGWMGVLISVSVLWDFFTRKNPSYLQFFIHEFRNAFMPYQTGHPIDGGIDGNCQQGENTLHDAITNSGCCAMSNTSQPPI